MANNDDWITELGREWTGRQEKAEGEKRWRVDEERPRREARQHFWAEFRAAVEQIVGDFNAAVGQSLVELSPGQTNVSSLGVRADHPLARHHRLGFQAPDRATRSRRRATQASVRHRVCRSTSLTCLPAQMLSPASSSSRGSSRLCEDGNVRPE